MQVPVQVLSDAAVMPKKAHGAEDAAFDLHAVEGGTVPAGDRGVFGTGLAFALPVGTVGLVKDRSGLASRQGVTVLGGVIDAGYRGELKVILFNSGRTPYVVRPGDRIAQLIIIRHEQVTLRETDVLPASVRGRGGFGSSGR